MIHRYLLLTGLLLLSACASDPAPNEQMRLSEQALEQARAVGAGEDLAEYQLATGKFVRAQKNMGEEDYKRARILAEQAELDARLAEAQVLRQKSEAQLTAMHGSIDRLRRKLGNLQ